VQAIPVQEINRAGGSDEKWGNRRGLGKRGKGERWGGEEARGGTSTTLTSFSGASQKASEAQKKNEYRGEGREKGLFTANMTINLRMNTEWV